MKKIIIALLLFINISASADKYLTKTGKIIFNADAAVEKIEGTNRAVGILLNSETGDLNFSVLIKSFVFEKKLMQEHFNENYLESDKYPKSTFAGKITNLSAINFSKDGSYKANVSGKMTIHGVTKEVTSTGTIVIKNSKPTLTSSFTIKLSDYNITIPNLVKDKVSNNVRIKVDAELSKI